LNEWFDAEMWEATKLTLKLAFVTTLLLLILGTPIAWWLSRSKSFIKEIIGTLVALPLVLPPTVLGFYLLLLLSPQGNLGSWLSEVFGSPFPFTFKGLVVGSVIYSLPFVVQPIRNSFEAIGEHSLEAAASLRASPFDVFFSIALPLARPGILTGSVLGFAHTVGEFGVILMLGGNIPGETKVLSVAIYDYVESLQWEKAHVLAGGMIGFSFCVILATTLIERHWREKR